MSTFTVLIPSIGRKSLTATLQSVSRQRWQDGDQAIVIFDSFEAPDQAAHHDLVAHVDPRIQSVAYDSGYHWYGVEQLNYALRDLPLTGSHVLLLGDDDVFVDGAFDVIRPVCDAHPGQAVIWRFVAPWRQLLWDVPRMQMSRISGCCIAAPMEVVGPLSTRRYVEHDYDWMLDVIHRTGQVPYWLDEVLVIARPDRRGSDVAHQPIWRCAHCARWTYGEDHPAGEPCQQCGMVLA